ncbi:hypothetical protein [Pseudomonas sp. EMN2]|uniref:hypothetical protein n=1 Tax=Pseudomonas sp. EMN2 TaxID=2615212 RepID=UPI00129A0D0D|nr:hypothetical protein [Pseudomonas sp. EMN2]
MDTDRDAAEIEATPAPFTTARIKSIVLDHVLDNMKTLVPPGSSVAKQLAAVLDTLEDLAQKIAVEALVNRHDLTPGPSAAQLLNPGSTELADPTLYELRYRIVMKGADGTIERDDTMTKQEIDELCGPGFVEQKFGLVGEKCPNSSTYEGNTFWFSVERCPKNDLNLSQQHVTTPTRSPSLG